MIYFMPVVTTSSSPAPSSFGYILSNNGPLADVVYWFANFTGLPITPPNWLNSTRYCQVGRGDADASGRTWASRW
jgi:hypothetical protein